jgi:hypothetical protein
MAVKSYGRIPHPGGRNLLLERIVCVRVANPYRSGRGLRPNFLTNSKVERPLTDTKHSRTQESMQIAILLYPGVTALDAVGPWEILSRLLQAEVRFFGA